MTYQWHKLESSLMHVDTFYRIAKRNFRLIVFLVKYSAYKQIIKLFIKRRMSGKLRYIYYCIVWSAGNENDVARSVGTSLSIQSRENDITRHNNRRWKNVAEKQQRQKFVLHIDGTFCPTPWSHTFVRKPNWVDFDKNSLQCHELGSLSEKRTIQFVTRNYEKQEKN